MAHAWRDEDGCHRADWDQFAIELDVASAFEDEVDLGEFFVIVGFCVLGNVDEVNRRGGVFRNRECPPCRAAGTFGGFDLIEVGDNSFLHVRILPVDRHCGNKISAVCGEVHVLYTANQSNVSIRAPRVGSDTHSVNGHNSLVGFNPRPPRGER